MNKIKTNLRLDTNLKSRNTSKNKIRVTLRDLMTLTFGYLAPKRITESGLKCAANWKYNNKQYNDCTTDKTPDGKVLNNKSWCMVENSNDSDVKWQICKPNMDYNQVRQESQKIQKQQAELLKRSAENLEKESEEVKKQVSDYKKAIEDLNGIGEKINNIDKNIEDVNNNVIELEGIDKEIKINIEKVKKLATLLNTVKKKKDIENKMESQQEKNQLEKTSFNFDTLEEVIANIPSKANSLPEEKFKDEENFARRKINSFIQQKIDTKCVACDGYPGYEHDEDGNGLLGKYYGSSEFTGASLTRIDNKMSFDFTGAAPMPGLNQYEFSIEWSGYVKIPVTQEYTFYIESDCGAQLSLSNKKIASLRMFSTESDTYDRSNQLLKEYSKRNTSDGNSNYNETRSKPIKLVANQKYLINVKYYHSSHDSPQENEETYFKLSWSSEGISKEIIPTNLLYSKVSTPPLIVTTDSKKTGVVSKLINNDLAFIDKDNYLIDDVPSEFHGVTSVVMHSMNKNKEISLEVNSAVVLYLCKISYYDITFPSDFEDVNQCITVHKLDHKQANPKKEEVQNIIQAEDSTQYCCYKKSFPEGQINIPINRTGLATKGNSLLLFLTVDDKELKPIACGGTKLWVSQPNGPYYQSCIESSKYGDGWGCHDGLNGQLEEVRGKFWQSNGEGEDAYIKINLKDIFMIDSFTYKDKNDLRLQNKKLRISFSSGEYFDYEHFQSSEAVDVNLDKPYKTSWIKVTILEVNNSINSGGSFKFYGMACEPQNNLDDAEIKPIFESYDDDAFYLDCQESITNSNQFHNVDKSFNTCYDIICPDSCNDSVSSYIYGNKKYSKDSVVCKAAAHSGAIGKSGGQVKLCFGKKEVDLPSNFRNGIGSQFKKESDLTYYFKGLDDKKNKELNKLPEVGDKFDLNDPSIGKFVPAVITSVDESTGRAMYQNENMPIDNNGQSSITLAKNKNVYPCGLKIKGRNCASNSISTKKNSIKIRFVTEDYIGNGNFERDTGKTFGYGGKPFGWNMVMTNKIVKSNVPGPISNENDHNIIETYAKFYPDKKSKHCRSKINNCPKSSYTIRTGAGIYKVKVYSLLSSHTQLNLQFNGEPVARNKEVRPNELVIVEGTVDTNGTGGDILITSNCLEEDCEYSFAKINMIVVSKSNLAEAKQEDEPNNGNGPNLNDICNKFKSGSQCDDNREGNVFNCLFENQFNKGSQSCGGGKFFLTKLPNDYKRCPQASNKYLCTASQFNSSSECNLNCPGKCGNLGGMKCDV